MRSSAAVTLPRQLRNRLGTLIADALSDGRARAAIGALAAAAGDPQSLAHAATSLAALPGDPREPGPGDSLPATAWALHAHEVGERAGRAWALLRGLPLLPPDPPPARALDAAAALWDAGLYFEMHEWLERAWRRAPGTERAALQGLIQVAVGFHHLGGGNIAGAVALLRRGADTLAGRAIGGVDLAPFSREIRRTADRIAARGGAAGRGGPRGNVPRLPRSDPRG